MPPLTDYNDIKQTTANACGAFALAAALHGLGYPVTTTHPIKRLNQNQDAYSQNFDATVTLKTSFAELLYQGTGNLNLNSNPATYDYNGDPMNSPSALVFMADFISAQKLIIKVNIIKDSRAMITFTALDVTSGQPPATKTLYVKEKELISTMRCKSGQLIPVDDALPDYNKPNPDVLNLLLVGPAGSAPDHWIAVDQTICYDPGLGNATTYTYTLPPLSFPTITIDTLPPTVYEFSGLWISLEP